jgi:hypothetical protein
MSVPNPFDPLGIYKAWTDAAERTTEQLREAQRQARLTAARADIDASYGAFRNISDTKSAENLLKAVEAYIELCK